MIPEEVAMIAEILGEHFKGSAADGLEYYTNVAWDIYDALRKHQELMSDAVERHS